MASVEKRFHCKIMEVLLMHNILMLIFKLNPGFLFLTQGVLGSETGERAKVDLLRNMAVGCWMLAIGCWLLAVGYWLLAIGCWLLAVGYWLLAIGYWMLVV
ncbi:MAG: hypothetical protein Q8S18_07240 [Bacteroidales bacterium]|nr:hypothetical protein [Bacteroidales bacterium]